MNNLQEPEPLPIWRIVMWAVIAAVCADIGIYYFAIMAGNPAPPPSQYFMGPVLGVFLGIAIYWNPSLRARQNQNLLPRATNDPDSSGQDQPSQPIFVKVIYCLIGGSFLFLAGLGVYQGHTSMGRHSHHEIYASRDPVFFWLNIAFYVALGGYMIFRAFRPPKNDG